MLADALEHLRAAILLLDEAEAPAHIAAHVDLAMNQLENLVGRAAHTVDARSKAGSIGIA